MAALFVFVSSVAKYYGRSPQFNENQMKPQYRSYLKIKSKLWRKVDEVQNYRRFECKVQLFIYSLKLYHLILSNANSIIFNINIIQL